MNLTPEFLTRLNLVMEECHGVIADAAPKLGMTSDQLAAVLHNHKDLELQWCDRQVNAQSEAALIINREANDRSRISYGAYNKTEKSEEQAIAHALRKENAMVRKGIEAMGLDGKKLELALMMQAVNGRQYQSLLELMNVGGAMLALDFLAEAQAIKEELKSKPMDLKREEALMAHRRGIGELYAKLWDRVEHGSLTQAKVKALQQQKAGVGGKAKPGFTPLVAIKAEGNVTLQADTQQQRTSTPAAG